MKNVNWKKVSMLALAALLVQIALSKLVYPFIGKSTTQLFAIEPATGVGGKVFGDKILGYMTGFIPFHFSNWAGWISMFIGAFVLIWVGMFIYDMSWAWKGKNQTGRNFAILLYGHIVLYLVLLLLKIGTVPGIAANLAIGLAINLFAIAGILSFSAKHWNFPRV